MPGETSTIPSQSSDTGQIGFPPLPLTPFTERGPLQPCSWLLPYYYCAWFPGGGKKAFQRLRNPASYLEATLLRLPQLLPRFLLQVEGRLFVAGHGGPPSVTMLYRRRRVLLLLVLSSVSPPLLSRFASRDSMQGRREADRGAMVAARRPSSAATVENGVRAAGPATTREIGGQSSREVGAPLSIGEPFCVRQVKVPKQFLNSRGE